MIKNPIEHISDKFNNLPDSDQHLIKAIGAGVGALVYMGLGALGAKQKESYASHTEALVDGMDSANKIVVGMVGSGLCMAVASQEYEAFKRTSEEELTICARD